MGGDHSQKLLPRRGIILLSGAQTSGSLRIQHCSGKLPRWGTRRHQLPWPSQARSWFSYRLPGSFLASRPGSLFPCAEGLLERGVIRIGLSVQEEQADLRALMRRYRNRPMSLADACLVRLSEIHNSGEIFTLDLDFRIYRRHGNKVIPVRMPD
jgi:hypothetical protein